MARTPDEGTRDVAARVLADALSEGGYPALAKLVVAEPGGVALGAMTPAQALELAALISRQSTA